MTYMQHGLKAKVAMRVRSAGGPEVKMAWNNNSGGPGRGGGGGKMAAAVAVGGAAAIAVAGAVPSVAPAAYKDVIRRGQSACAVSFPAGSTHSRPVAGLLAAIVICC